MGSVSADENLILNPDFEAVSQNKPISWDLSDNVTSVTHDVYSGNRAAQITSGGDSASLVSNWFEVTPHTRIEAKAQIKIRDVIPGSKDWHLARVTLSAYEADQTTKIKHWDLVSVQGSFDWRPIRGSVIVPPRAKYMRLAFRLSECSGVMWIDETEVTVAQTVPDINLSGLEKPILLPQPWQAQLSHETLNLGHVGIQHRDGDERLKDALNLVLTDLSASTQPILPNQSSSQFDTLIILGDSQNLETDARLQQVYPNTSWSDLGRQGYFLSIVPGPNQHKIYLGANDEQGRFYGLQTIKQLIDQDRQELYVADIIDRPLLERRGIVMGTQLFTKRQQSIEQMAELKLNFVWNQGSFLSERFWYRWRDPLTPSQKRRLAEYVTLANKNFIDPYIAIGPRGPNAANPTYYSSDTEIDLVVNKMAELYDLGVRHFGLAFDDLVNVGQDRLFGPDISFFEDDIGQAHAYFIKEVYQRLKSKHADINLMVVPMQYNKLGNLDQRSEAYLQALGQLPMEIQFYSSVIYPEEVEVTLRTTHRPHLVWDNFWSQFYNDKLTPEFVIPIDRPRNFNNDRVAGFTFLPLIPLAEDTALITWHTAADYAWAPERYNAEVSFQLAAAHHLGISDAAFAPKPTVETPIITVNANPNVDAGYIIYITTDTPQTTIHYTLDGSVPLANSAVYTSPLLLHEFDTLWVKAKARRLGYKDSAIVSTRLEVDSAEKYAESSQNATTSQFFGWLQSDFYTDYLSGIYEWIVSFDTLTQKPSFPGLGLGAVFLFLVGGGTVWLVRKMEGQASANSKDITKATNPKLLIQHDLQQGRNYDNITSRVVNRSEMSPQKAVRLVESVAEELFYRRNKRRAYFNFVIYSVSILLGIVIYYSRESMFAGFYQKYEVMMYVSIVFTVLLIIWGIGGIVWTIRQVKGLDFHKY